MVGSTGSTVSNVTAIASGANSAGIQSRYNDATGGTHTLTLTNSIAEGASDLRTEDSAGTGRIVVSNSNFDSTKAETEGAITGSANQAAPPLFVNAASGDYRPAPGSPTIDAGAPGELGALDLAGNPRVLGSAPDIGAYEFVPPPPTGMLTSLAVSPKSFKPRKGGGAIASAAKRPKARAGATVRYSISAATTVNFTVRACAEGSAGRRQMQEADARQPREEEVHPLQGTERRLHPPGRRGAELLQVLRPGPGQSAEARQVQARRPSRRLGQTRRFQDRQMRLIAATLVCLSLLAGTAV